jgi:hypothetical protein
MCQAYFTVFGQKTSYVMLLYGKVWKLRLIGPSIAAELGSFNAVVDYDPNIFPCGKVGI